MASESNARPLRLAVQKSGRLFEDSSALIRECGIHLPRRSDVLKAQSSNFPIELFYLRDDDIPRYVASGVADAGIVGENVVLEKGYEVREVDRLGYAKCRLSLAVPKTFSYRSLSDLEGKRIATSYPRILKSYLSEHALKASIHEISGSVEIGPSIGLSDAVCDLVSSGSTLLKNGLKEIEVVMESEAVLIAHTEIDPEVEAFLSSLVFRIRAVNAAKNNKYIVLNAPNEAIEQIASFLPGMRSPTVLPLAQEGWSSLHSVVRENDFWEVVEKLRAAGAEGILVVPIEKMLA